MACIPGMVLIMQTFPSQCVSSNTSQELVFYSRVITADPLTHGWVKHALSPAYWSALHTGSNAFLFTTHNGILIGCVFLCTDKAGVCESNTVYSMCRFARSRSLQAHLCMAGLVCPDGQIIFISSSLRSGPSLLQSRKPCFFSTPIARAAS